MECHSNRRPVYAEERLARRDGCVRCDPRGAAELELIYHPLLHWEGAPFACARCTSTYKYYPRPSLRTASSAYRAVPSASAASSKTATAEWLVGAVSGSRRCSAASAPLRLDIHPYADQETMTGSIALLAACLVDCLISRYR